MPITAICTDAQVNFIWSQYAIDLRLDDDFNGSEDSGLRAVAYQKATLDVFNYLLARYSVATVSASTWAQWAAAMFAAVFIARRRGNDCPESMLSELQRYVDALEEIKNGNRELIADDGLATPDFDCLPCVSNMVVDSRYGSEAVRRVASTSTGLPAVPPARQRDALEPWPRLF